MTIRGRRLTAAQVIEMRQHARAGEVITDIARCYDLGVRAVRRILQGKAWARIEDPAGAGPVKYATKTTVKQHNKAVRPVCPHCQGFVEADSNDHKGIFLQCESCFRTWPALVTPHERRRAGTLSAAIQTHPPTQEQRATGTGEAQDKAGTPAPPMGVRSL